MVIIGDNQPLEDRLEAAEYNSAVKSTWAVACEEVMKQAVVLYSMAPLCESTAPGISKGISGLVELSMRAITSNKELDCELQLAQKKIELLEAQIRDKDKVINTIKALDKPSQYNRLNNTFINQSGMSPLVCSGNF